jgi:hypothetical protein
MTTSKGFGRKCRSFFGTFVSTSCLILFALGADPPLGSEVNPTKFVQNYFNGSKVAISTEPYKSDFYVELEAKERTRSLEYILYGCD